MSMAILTCSVSLYRRTYYTHQKATEGASYTAITLLSPTLKTENILQIFHHLHTCMVHAHPPFSHIPKLGVGKGE